MVVQVMVMTTFRDGFVERVCCVVWSTSYDAGYSWTIMLIMPNRFFIKLMVEVTARGVIDIGDNG